MKMKSKIEPPIKILENWILKDKSFLLFENLKENLNWRDEYIFIFGRKVKVPRKVAFIGDDNLNYKYSGIHHSAAPWTEELLNIKHKLARQGLQFNSVLCNLYENGLDYMGWHTDSEKELGPDPIIASISLGETRKFCIRHKITKEKTEIFLKSGSLLLMLEGSQIEWEHSLPKSIKVNEPRINLTFRYIYQ